MKNWKAALAALGGIAAVIIISAFGATSAGTRPYKTEHMAAWIQAVGSIAAIGGVVWAVERQSRDSLKAISAEAELAVRQRRLAAVSIVDAAMERAEQIRRTMQIQNVNELHVELYRSYDRSILDGLVRALQSIPLHEIGASKAIGELLLFTDQITFLANAIQRFLDGPLRDPTVGPEIKRYLDGPADGRSIGQAMLTRAIELHRESAMQHLDAMRNHYAGFSNALSKLVNV
ncbi:hypothetical protein [Burkholderia multivorans]|uniref:hypothetical protein n=1 Tax=Burkholderia multivorans TaxID=87883 RepID=UPI000ABFBD6A|nr:hypothetical protein [Burkholderia multivorans]